MSADSTHPHGHRVTKRVLIVYAHPEPTSLNGALKDIMVEHLQRSGHAVQVTDLYAHGRSFPVKAPC